MEVLKYCWGDTYTVSLVPFPPTDSYACVCVVHYIMEMYSSGLWRKLKYDL